MTRNNKGQFVRGHKPYSSRNISLKISKALKGKQPKNSVGWKGKKHPLYGKRRPEMFGENNPSWKGGTTPLVRKVRNCFKYRQWRSDIFTRDDYCCQICWTRGKIIHADHYPRSFSEIFHGNNIKTMEEALNCEELWNINNGRTLCQKCHKRTENYGGPKKGKN